MGGGVKNRCRHYVVFFIKYILEITHFFCLHISTPFLLIYLTISGQETGYFANKPSLQLEEQEIFIARYIELRNKSAISILIWITCLGINMLEFKETRKRLMLSFYVIVVVFGVVAFVLLNAEVVFVVAVDTVEEKNLMLSFILPKLKIYDVILGQ